jgi:hypothetical protein
MTTTERRHQLRTARSLALREKKVKKEAEARERAAKQKRKQLNKLKGHHEIL